MRLAERIAKAVSKANLADDANIRGDTVWGVVLNSQDWSSLKDEFEQFHERGTGVRGGFCSGVTIHSNCGPVEVLYSSALESGRMLIVRRESVSLEEYR